MSLLGKNWVMFSLHLPFRITCCRVSSWNWHQFLSLFNVYQNSSSIQKILKENRNKNGKRNGWGVKIY